MVPPGHALLRAGADRPQVAWELAAGLNLIISVCYVLIAAIIVRGLVHTRQLTTNPLALATAAIFSTCAAHHAHHALHLLDPAVAAGSRAGLRAVLGSLPSVAVDTLGAVVAVVYLGLRHSYGALLNTPAMFDDAVLRATERRLRELAYLDALTGVPNRAAYQQLADDLRSRAGPVAVLLVDLDDFKQVNDQLGHDAGDRVLRVIAQRLVAATEAQERVFRLGGDEFVLLAMDADPRAAAAFAARVDAAVDQPVQLAEGEVRIRGSVGVACGVAAAGVDALLREADVAMYRGKARAATDAPRVLILPAAAPMRAGAAAVPAQVPAPAVERRTGSRAAASTVGISPVGE